MDLAGSTDGGVLGICLDFERFGGMNDGRMDGHEAIRIAF